jgi:glycosyltransferase involved in cell wall biosynthesis
MRITYISKALIVGAYQTKMEAIAAHPGIELTVVVPPSWREGERVQHLEILHTSGYRLITAPLTWNGSFHLHYYPTLGRILRQTQPDICHIDEEPYNLATYLATKAARRLGAKALFFTWQNLLRRYPCPFGAMEQHVYRVSAAAIAGNSEAAQVLRSKGYSGPIATIPQFGVDPELFKPTPKPYDVGSFTIGYAGRLVEQKGLLVLLRALTLLRGDWRLEICGSGPLQQLMQAELDMHGLGSRVTFHQQIPSNRMPEFYNRLNVLVLPSLTRPNWKEQFGRVLIEAMACGIPVLGSSSGEIPNVIGSAGIITPEGDVQELAYQLDQIRNSIDLQNSLGAAGRERMLAHYTQAQIAQATVDVYYSLAEGITETAPWNTPAQVL